MASGATSDDDIPETPRNAPVSRDTERDLPRPDRTSSMRPSDPDERRTTLGENTLLSLKTGELAHGASEPDSADPRIDELERRFSQLEARLRVIEMGRAASTGSDRRWLIWVGLLIALAVGWQLRALVR